MRERKAVDTWVQVLSLAMGIVLIFSVLAFLAVAGSTPARDVLSLFSGIAAAAGMTSAVLYLSRVLLPKTILLVIVWGALIVIPIIFTRLSFGVFYFAGVVGFGTVLLTWWIQNAQQRNESQQK
jgi:hypothetical protein